VATTTRSKAKKAEPMTPPELREVVTLEGDELARARAWFEDKVVREVRRIGYCEQSLKVLDSVFGGPVETNLVYDATGRYGNGSEYSGVLYPAYLDSDGVDCWGNIWRDLTTKLDRNGFDPEGRDKDGYDKDGYDVVGFNREGVDKDGVSRDDPNRYRFGVDGYDAEGYNREGFNADGYNREGIDRRGHARPQRPLVFDANGRDADGYNASGYRVDGSYSEDVYMKYRSMRRGL
jgi:hypothetical protein